MKNKLSDLNDHLFAQLERLGEETLKGDALEAEISRGKAITGVAREVISNAATVLRAEELRSEYARPGKMPAFLCHDGDDSAA